MTDNAEREQPDKVSIVYAAAALRPYQNSQNKTFVTAVVTSSPHVLLSALRLTALCVACARVYWVYCTPWTMCLRLRLSWSTAVAVKLKARIGYSASAKMSNSPSGLGTGKGEYRSLLIARWPRFNIALQLLLTIVLFAPVTGLQMSVNHELCALHCS